ncbi:MAG: ASCH domain-containing protein [Candidatus Falkowbacteria bacterium]
MTQNKVLKRLKFSAHLVAPILDGSKTVTWRLFDDKDLQVGDELELIESAGSQLIARASITAVAEKPLGEVTEDEMAENGYRDHAHVLEFNRQLYGASVTEDTLVKIITFEIKK